MAEKVGGTGPVDRAGGTTGGGGGTTGDDGARAPGAVGAREAG